MLVYGDHVENAQPAEELERLRARLADVAGAPPGIDRHGALTSVFIRLGQIAQGVADAECAAAGMDGVSPAADALMVSCQRLAAALIASWDSGFTALPPLPEVAVPEPIPAEIALRLPEGYAYYALYPEAYVETVRALGLQGAVRMIGIRSIGTGLAALVAAAVGAPPPLTVRPVGHPFAREVRIAPEAAGRLIAADAHYLVIDEGPGLSGSSFAAVARFLRGRGVPLDRIVLVASHAGGPGPRADERTRRVWAEVRSVAADSDRLLAAHLPDWVVGLVGPLDAPIEDLSGGGWRARRFTNEALWPAIDPRSERRKFLVRAGGEPWLVKFAGLGTEGERKRARARSLAAEGLVPEVRGLVHGFLVERWIESATVVRPGVDEIARYLGARSRLLDPPPCGGATLGALIEMAAFNIGTELGSGAAYRFMRTYGNGAALQERVAPMAVDGRCDACEWLRAADGRLFKADALDHDAGHDLVGAQDLAWDVAGAAIELDLGGDECAQLIALLGHYALRPVDPALVRFLTPCYLAFRLGAARMAEDMLSGWPAEQERSAALAQRYADRLAVLLD